MLIVRDSKETKNRVNFEQHSIRTSTYCFFKHIMGQILLALTLCVILRMPSNHVCRGVKREQLNQWRKINRTVAQIPSLQLLINRMRSLQINPTVLLFVSFRFLLAIKSERHLDPNNKNHWLYISPFSPFLLDYKTQKSVY